MNFFEAAASGRDIMPRNWTKYRDPWSWLDHLVEEEVKAFEWEVKPEEKPEPIQLKPSDIGKVVKLKGGNKGGNLDTILAKDDRYFFGREWTWSPGGESPFSQGCIVEILGYPHEIDWKDLSV